MEDLSPELAGLKQEIEESANVDEEVKDTIPTTEADSNTTAADMMGAMSKAKAVMAGLDEREDGLTDETEISLAEVSDTGDAGIEPTTPEPAGESIDYSSVEPVVPPTTTVDVPTYSAEDMMAAQQSYGLANQVAQMVPAEYENWLFPPMGHPGYHLGQLSLARVIANLSSAGYNSASMDEDPVIYPRKVQIAASTWSQTHYQGSDLAETRQQLTLAPAAEIQALVPHTVVSVPDLVSSQYPPLSESESLVVDSSKPASKTPVILNLAATSLAAVAVPIFLMRRWTKV